MSPVARTLVVALLTFASGLLGFFLQWLLPVQDVVGARGVLGSIIALVAMLLALVLGLLIWSTYGAFIAQNAESQSLGPLILKLDFALEQYGPEAERGRDLLRAAVVRARSLLGQPGGRRDALRATARGPARHHEFFREPRTRHG